MPRRKVGWNMGPKYSQGWTRGVEDTEAEYRRDYHLSGIPYSEIYQLIDEKGRISLRHNTYPIVVLNLTMLNNDFYLIKPIGEKLMWSRFQQWAKGTIIQLIWEGENAQVLIRKIFRYMGTETEMKVRAMQALKWLPRKGGGPEPEIEVDKMALW